MNSLLLAIAAIATLCGPRVQQGNLTALADAKKCQIQMLDCVQAKTSTPIDTALAQCVKEVK